MAPLPTPTTLTTLLTSLLKRTTSTTTSSSFHLQKRELADPSAGVTPFAAVPNKAVFAIFGLLGAGFVLTGIWFFFWAKNGGFYFHENDWEDYKSTVLRRKGPNGTTLSGATESTDLGGGSIVHNMSEKGGQSVWGRMTRGRGGRKEKKGKAGKKRYESYRDDDETTAYLGSEGGSSLGSEMSDIKREKKRAYKEAKSVAGKPKKSRFHRTAHTETSEATETLTVADPDEEVDIGVQNTIRAYRHEKPARVGGLNKPADGSSWDGSTEASQSEVLMNHREPTPTNTPTKERVRRSERNDKYTGGSGGIRKVVSTSQHAPSSDFWNRNHAATSSTPSETDTNITSDRDRERIRAEARKLQEKGRAASTSNRNSRRDFSFQHGDDNSTVITETTVSSEDAEREARRERRERRRESKSPTKRLEVPGGFYEGSEVSNVSGSTVSGSARSGDTGTKSYHHPIPGLSVRDSAGAAEEYKEERRKRRAARDGGGGYRRSRRDSLE